MKRLEIAARTDPGRVRPNNEDDFAVLADAGLLVVCDGMGGHSSGEVASRIATSTVRESAVMMLSGSAPAPAGDGGKSPRARRLEGFVKSANSRIFEEARAIPQDHGMGTTIVAALVDEKGMTVAHVGDSRLYLLRGGRLQLLTEDHSLVMDQVRRGILTMAEAERSNIQNILTRALGTESEVTVDVQDCPIVAGDILLLCSDGLTKHVGEEEISRAMREGKDVDDICETLIRKANEGGGTDNITCVVARVPAAAPSGLKGLLARLFH